MRTPKDSTIHNYTKIRYSIRERTPSSKSQSSIIQKLPSSSCTEQISNNQNQKEGETSRKASTERKKSYADIFSQIYVIRTKLIIVPIPIRNNNHILPIEKNRSPTKIGILINLLPTIIVDASTIIFPAQTPT